MVLIGVTFLYMSCMRCRLNLYCKHDASLSLHFVVNLRIFVVMFCWLSICFYASCGSRMLTPGSKVMCQSTFMTHQRLHLQSVAAVPVCTALNALWADYGPRALTMHCSLISLGMSHRSHHSPFLLDCIVRTSRALKQEKQLNHIESVQGRSCSGQVTAPQSNLDTSPGTEKLLAHPLRPWDTTIISSSTLELRKPTLEPCP